MTRVPGERLRTEKSWAPRHGPCQPREHRYQVLPQPCQPPQRWPWEGETVRKLAENSSPVPSLLQASSQASLPKYKHPSKMQFGWGLLHAHVMSMGSGKRVPKMHLVLPVSQLCLKGLLGAHFLSPSFQFAKFHHQKALNFPGKHSYSSGVSCGTKGSRKGLGYCWFGLIKWRFI